MPGDPSRVNKAGSAGSEKGLTSAEAFSRMMLLWCLRRFLFFSPSGQRRPDPSPGAKPFAARAKKACGVWNEAGMSLKIKDEELAASSLLTFGLAEGQRVSIEGHRISLGINKKTLGVRNTTHRFSSRQRVTSKATMCPGINRYVNYVPIAKAAPCPGSLARPVALTSPAAPQGLPALRTPASCPGELSLLTRLRSGRGAGASLRPSST